MDAQTKSSAQSARRRLVPLAIIGLLLVLGIPELKLARLFAETPIGARIGREIVWIALGALVLLWVTKVERLPLSSIGLVRPRWSTIGWGLAGAVLMVASVMLTFAVIAPALGMKQNLVTTAAVVQVPMWLFITTPIVAGVTEELVYRGYAIERLEFLTGKPWLAALVAGGAFFLVHLSWGGTQMILVGFGTIIMVGLYLWRRDLPCVMLAHGLADLIGFALARAQM